MSVFTSQVPSGSINGTNTIFLLTATGSPITAFEFYWNGLYMSSPQDYAFSIGGTSTATITTTQPPQTGDILGAWIWQQ
jgi:hypothetical protein